MKCQKCEKAATFHITELTGTKPHEHHLCEDHAREYLNDSSEHSAEASGLASTLAKGISQNASLSKAASELKELDKQRCQVCGMSFYEFRHKGRLGCPNDYDAFMQQLEPLILSIHGEQEHTGKIPKRGASGNDVAQKNQLIRLRKELEVAVQREEYEKASKLRDMIKEIQAE